MVLYGERLGNLQPQIRGTPLTPTLTHRGERESGMGRSRFLKQPLFRSPFDRLRANGLLLQQTRMNRLSQRSNEGLHVGETCFIARRWWRRRPPPQLTHPEWPHHLVSALRADRGTRFRLRRIKQVVGWPNPPFPSPSMGEGEGGGVPSFGRWMTMGMVAVKIATRQSGSTRRP
jgi:hypothetical protein